jgi:hypothetical protein
MDKLHRALAVSRLDELVGRLLSPETYPALLLHRFVVLFNNY